VQTPLPVDAAIDDLVSLVRAEKRAVVIAPPGAGKTTRIPPALTRLGRTILLQPRRVAARALARRIASERGWTIGEEIGWQIRFERRFSARTSLLVATEGILTARLQSDPLLSDFSVVVLDEFHERSIHADLALALVKQAADARGDLAVVVMSATMDADPVAKFLGARVIEIEARNFPIDVRYAPNVSMQQAVRDVGMDAPLVEFVEHDDVEVAEQRIRLQPRGEDPLGRHEQPGAAGEPPLEADLPADLLPDRPPLLRRDAPRQRAGGDAAGLQKDRPPQLAREGRRDARGLSRSRRRDDDGRAPGAHRGENGRDVAVDGKHWMLNAECRMLNVEESFLHSTFCILHSSLTS